MDCKQCPFTKREIDALKACAAEKMNEPTPEEVELWDDALYDPYGDS